MNSSERSENAANDMAECIRLLQDTKLAMGLISEQILTQWKRDGEKRDKLLTDLRQWRMAVDQENIKLVASCADVRKFFLSADHEKEIARLKEFIDICERLQALQKSGMLDSVADVILKLDTRP